jgi:quercetin dioxygenase-like cupin family protein
MRIIRWRADRKPTQDEVLSILQDEGLDCQVETSDAGTEIKDHKHPFDEIRIVVRGAIRYNVAGNEFILREGDRLELPSNTRHWTKVEASSECVSVFGFKVN